jgi:hypothetical protein
MSELNLIFSLGNKKDDHVSFSLQAAVISRIIKNPQEFSQQLVSF